MSDAGMRAAYDAKVADLAVETRRVSTLIAAIEADGHRNTLGEVHRFKHCGLCSVLREVMGAASTSDPAA